MDLERRSVRSDWRRVKIGKIQTKFLQWTLASPGFAAGHMLRARATKQWIVEASILGGGHVSAAIRLASVSSMALSYS